MSKKLKTSQEKTAESGKFQRLRKIVDKAKAFLNQRYVWLSLTAGFLWMFSAPIVITIFQGALGDSIDSFIWIFQAIFFPFTFASLIITDATAPGVWVIIYLLSFVISMCLCLTLAYIIHRLCIKKSVK